MSKFSSMIREEDRQQKRNMLLVRSDKMEQSVKTGLVVGIALVVAALILGVSFYQVQKPKSTIQVVGLGMQEFDSDTVKWVVTIEEESEPDDLKGGYRKLDKGVQDLISDLKARGIADEEISIKPPYISKDYNYEEARVTRIRYQQSVIVITKDIDTVEKLAFNPIELLEKDINVMSSKVEFFYSGTDELKKALVADATANARERAEMMLENTDVKLGKLISLRSGVFQITEPYSTDVSSLGIYDTSTKRKQISVTATAVFALQ